MKKILSFMVAIVFSLLCAVPAYAAEKTAEAVPGGTDISVYARYVDNTGFTTIITDENGNGRVTLPDGTKIIISGADASKGRIVVEKVTDKDVLDWISEKLGSKAKDAKVYYVYFLDENGTSWPTSGVTVTIKPKDASDYSVYAVSDSKTGKLQSAAQNGAVTFTTDGSSFYALCKGSKVTPGDKSPQTGDTSNLVLRIALLLASGGTVVATTVVGRKKKLSVK